MQPAYPGPAYQIKTQRVIIRCYNPSDAPLLKASVEESLDHLSPWMPWASGEQPSLQDRIAFLRQLRGKFDLGQDFVYGIFTPDGSRVIGGTGLHTRLGPTAREIGYWINKNFINQGIATEVSAALTRVAFEIDQVSRVEIHCDPANVRSAAVPRKLGFTHDATLRGRLAKPDGTLRDTMIWSLFKDDYPGTPCTSAEIEAYDAMGRRIL